MCGWGRLEEESEVANCKRHVLGFTEKTRWNHLLSTTFLFPIYTPSFCPIMSSPAAVLPLSAAAPNGLGVEAMFQQIMDAVHKSVCDVFSEPVN